jgi:hypothetical protein
MLPEQREELIRQFHNKVHHLLMEVQDAQGMFIALAPIEWLAYDRCCLMNDAFELLKRDANVAIDRVWKVESYLKTDNK